MRGVLVFFRPARYAARVRLRGAATIDRQSSFDQMGPETASGGKSPSDRDSPRRSSPFPC